MTLSLTPDELLTTTRAVRKRLDFDREVSRSLIEECLDVGLQAPNGSNMQLWQWVVVDDRGTIERLAAVYNAALAAYSEVYESQGLSERAQQDPGFGRMTESVMHLAENLHRSPAILIPCIAGRMDSLDIFSQASLWGSVIPAIWNFMLALRARGLGSAWTTVHLHREAEAAELLGIPYAEYTQAGLFPVAYTLGTEFRPGHRAPVAEVLSWDRF